MFYSFLYEKIWEKVCLINSNTILQNARRITQPSAKQLKHAIGLSHSQLVLFPFLSLSISPEYFYGINAKNCNNFIGKLKLMQVLSDHDNQFYVRMKTIFHFTHTWHIIHNIDLKSNPSCVHQIYNLISVCSLWRCAKCTWNHHQTHPYTMKLGSPRILILHFL